MVCPTRKSFARRDCLKVHFASGQLSRRMLQQQGSLLWTQPGEGLSVRLLQMSSNPVLFPLDVRPSSGTRREPDACSTQPVWSKFRCLVDLNSSLLCNLWLNSRSGFGAGSQPLKRSSKPAALAGWLSISGCIPAFGCSIGEALPWGWLWASGSASFRCLSRCPWRWWQRFFSRGMWQQRPQQRGLRTLSRWHRSGLWRRSSARS